MKHILKKTGAAFLAAALLFAGQPAYAAEETPVLRTKTIDITGDLDLVSQTLYSEASADYTRENFFVYRPEGDTLPLVCYGNDIAGAASASRVFALEETAGNHIVGLTNGGFFVLATGVSIGPVIKNGQVKTSGYSEEVIAFDDEGHVQMGDPELSVSLFVKPVDREIVIEETVPAKKDPEWEEEAGEEEPSETEEEPLPENEEDADGEALEEPLTRTEIISYDSFRYSKVNFNKTMGKEQGVVVYTSDFGETNGSSMETFNLICTIEEGDSTLGASIRATVERAFTTKTKTALEPGKLCLSMATATPYKATLSQMKNVLPGSSVEIGFAASEDYANTCNALGFESWLVKDGAPAEGLDDRERAPRTAAGIQKDGSFILYTADGRQAGYSAGFTYKELAERMAELGCIQAVNLDGGASTQLFANLPGEAANRQLNKDSLSNDLRKCGNYICFVNTQNPNGILDQLRIYPYGEYLLSGAGMDLSCLAADEHYYVMDAPQTLKYKVNSDFGKIDSNGHYISAGDGTAKIQVVGNGIKGTVTVNIIKTPSSIAPSVNGMAAKSQLTAFTGGMYKLQASAEYQKLPLASDPTCYKWTVSRNLGYIDDNYVFHAEGEPGAEGELTVKAGTTKVVIPVTLAEPSQIRALKPLYDVDALIQRVLSKQQTEEE